MLSLSAPVLAGVDERLTVQKLLQRKAQPLRGTERINVMTSV